MIFNLKDFSYEIRCENGHSDAVIETELNGDRLDLYLTATKDKPMYVELKWTAEDAKDFLVLGDAWERAYADLEFLPVAKNDRFMPWYFIATDKVKSLCFGVKTAPNAFVSFRFDNDGIKAIANVKNGGGGVDLGGRKLHVATFIKAEYDSGDAFTCLKDYCKKLCDNPILPKEIIYGGNNWYYAYGKSSYGEIIADAKLQVELAEGIDNKPFEVIDDCWQKRKCAGPWLPNKKFRDMGKLAAEIKSLGARPGIWVRLLNNKDIRLTRRMKLPNKKIRQYLDPTRPDVQAYIRADVERIRNWGFELMKHDFSTVDLFGSFGASMDEKITPDNGWHFYDDTKTNAEIVLDFYRLIKDAAGDMYIIGCNTVSHLSAGLVHIYRTGDDTSGKEWDRTKTMGVNTLAFRLAQNEAFYMCDADCVGILKDYIPWEKNKQWLHLLSKSNTPLFISCNNTITDEMKRDIKAAYKTFHEKHDFAPVDIYSTRVPKVWDIDGERVTYNWD